MTHKNPVSLDQATNQSVALILTIIIALLDPSKVSVGIERMPSTHTSKNRLCLADFNIDINSDKGKHLVQAKSQHEGLVAIVRPVVK